jgi:hypothetical protein
MHLHAYNNNKKKKTKCIETGKPATSPNNCLIVFSMQEAWCLLGAFFLNHIISPRYKNKRLMNLFIRLFYF